MAIAGAVVVPVKKEYESIIKKKLDSLKEVEVQDIGSKGIAVVMEADDSEKLRKISEEINAWKEVIDFQLAYLNWEDLEDTDQK